MPVLIIVGILSVYGVKEIVHQTGNKNNMSGDAINNMTSEMIGKDKRECNKILKKYRGNWLQR